MNNKYRHTINISFCIVNFIIWCFGISKLTEFVDTTILIIFGFFYIFLYLEHDSLKNEYLENKYIEKEKYLELLERISNYKTNNMNKE